MHLHYSVGGTVLYSFTVQLLYEFVKMLYKFNVTTVSLLLSHTHALTRPCGK